ncbi:MAG: S41 family peptidase, partial [Lutispora sp.]|nr:S41 family peptidase [Lutispora sp.]
VDQRCDSMKKTTVIALVFIFLLQANIYAAEDLSYFDAHFREIKEYYPSYEVMNDKNIPQYTDEEDLIQSLKNIYSSIDSYSYFYSKDEIEHYVNKDMVEQRVEYEIAKDIGYIRIFSFTDDTFERIIDALNSIEDNKINNIVLDLRDNKGGDIIESVRVAQLFVKEGLIAKIDFYSEEFEDIEYYSNLKELKYKLIVLVNNGTSSAAELLAGAIQDTDSGYIIGSKTFGKSKVQKLIPIMAPESFIKSNDIVEKPTINLLKASKQGVFVKNSDILGWAKITVGNFYTKNSKEIEGKGIQPNYNLDESIKIYDFHLYRK